MVAERRVNNDDTRMNAHFGHVESIHLLSDKHCFSTTFRDMIWKVVGIVFFLGFLEIFAETLDTMDDVVSKHKELYFLKYP